MTRTLDVRNGRLWIRTPWKSEAAGDILIDGERVAPAFARAGKGEFRCSHGPWRLVVRAEHAGAWSLRLTNTDRRPRALGTVVFARWRPEGFSAPLACAVFRELVCGGSFLAMHSGVKCVGRKTPFLDAIEPSSMLTVYQKEGGPALLLGILPPVGPALAEFKTLHSDPHLEGTFGFEVAHTFRCTVRPGQSVATPPIAAAAGRNGTDLMADFGKRWGALLHRPMKPQAVGWNSWDHFAGAIERTTFDENIDAAARHFGGALRVFVIDEGWECQWGTWTPNWKFPEGLADFCRHVKARGGVPGIWTAPLLVNTYNPLYLHHPDWFATQANGQPKIDSYSYGPMAYLDPTQPEVIRHLGGIFERLRACGFEYFKVDFSHCVLKADKFADPTVGRGELLRRAFAAIRAAIGDDAYLLSCGTPCESVVGLADAARISGDIHTFWGHVLLNAGPFAAKWWMHRNLWNNDPDFLVVRGGDTAEPPYGRREVVSPYGLGGEWKHGRVLNETEARTYALLLHLSGGDVVLGDHLPALKKKGVDMLRSVLEPRLAAVPVDLFDSDQDLPRVWVSRGRRDTLVGLFNWSDKPAALEFDARALRLAERPRDFWSGKPAGRLPARLAPRSALGLVFGGRKGT